MEIPMLMKGICRRVLYPSSIHKQRLGYMLKGHESHWHFISLAFSSLSVSDSYLAALFVQRNDTKSQIQLVLRIHADVIGRECSAKFGCEEALDSWRFPLQKVGDEFCNRPSGDFQGFFASKFHGMFPSNYVSMHPQNKLNLRFRIISLNKKSSEVRV